MNTLFDKLNLRPQERRLVMLAGVVLFVVLNVWLVFPHFNDWRVLQERLRTARRTHAMFIVETNKAPEYKAALDRLQNDDGMFVNQDDQPLNLANNVAAEATAANTFIQRISPAGGGPIPNNPFFEEQRVTVSALAGEPELVDFLKRLGSGNSLLRARDLDIKRDPSGTKLAASMTIVGNYLKKPGTKPGPQQKQGATSSRQPATPGQTKP